MPLPTAILYHGTLPAANNVQKSNMILWKQGPRFPQGLNKFSLLFVFPKLLGATKLKKPTPRQLEGMERDLASEEPLQHGVMRLLARKRMRYAMFRANQKNCFEASI